MGRVLPHHLHQDRFLILPLSAHTPRPTCAIVFQPLTDLWVTRWMNRHRGSCAMGGWGWGGLCMKNACDAEISTCLPDRQLLEWGPRETFGDNSERRDTTGEVMSLPCKCVFQQIIVLHLPLCLRETFPTKGRTCNQGEEGARVLTVNLEQIILMIKINQKFHCHLFIVPHHK